MNTAMVYTWRLGLLLVGLSAWGERAEASGWAVPLRVLAAERVPVPQGWPVQAGVPFKSGQLPLDRVDHLRVETHDGKPIPAQFEVRCKYHLSKSVQWLGVFLQAEPSVKEYRLVLDPRTGSNPASRKNPAPADPIRIEEGNELLTVETGVLKAEIPRSGPMLSRVWVGGALVLEQGPGDGNWFTTLDGRRHTGRFDEVAVERKGPLHATVRLRGRYFPSTSSGEPELDGKPSFKLQVRLHFFAGRPEIELTHTFTWVGSQEAIKIKDLAVSFMLKDPATRAAADRSAEPGERPVESDLPQGGTLALLQDELYHWGHGENHFSLQAGSPEKPEELHSGAKAGSWVAAWSDKAGAALALRDLWQQFPKELRAERPSAGSGPSSRLTALLWSTRGKALPMDLSGEGLKAFLGPVAGKEMSLMAPFKQRAFEKGSVELDPTGLAKSHDLLLRFRGPATDGARFAQDIEAYDDQPLLFPDPEWSHQSRVMGENAPRDPGRFAELEGVVDMVWEDWRKALDQWGDYGCLYYGWGPHGAWLVQGGVRPQPLFLDPHWPLELALWQGYLRCGDRRFFDHAYARSRAFFDVKMCHEDGAGRGKGDLDHWLGTIYVPWAGNAPERQFYRILYRSAWGSVPDWKSLWPPCGYDRFFTSFPVHYYITGDLRGADAAAEMAEVFKDILPRMPKDWVKHMPNYKLMVHKIEELACLYEFTGDPWFLEMTKEMVRAYVDPGNVVGLSMKPDGDMHIFQEDHLLVLLRALRILESEAPDEGALLQRGADGTAAYMRRMGVLHVGVRWLDTPVLVHGFRASGDPSYLKIAEDVLLRSFRRYRTTSRFGQRETFGWYGELMMGIQYPACVMSALREGPELPAQTLLACKGEMEPAAELVFLKDSGRAQRLELMVHSETRADPSGRAWPDAWARLGGVYLGAQYPGSYPGKMPVQWLQVNLPAEAPPGDYRIRVPMSGHLALLSADSGKFVLVAPEGLALRGRGGDEQGHPYYFMVPKGRRTLKLWASDPSRVQVVDADGRPVRPGQTKGGPATLQVPEGQDGRLWSMTGMDRTVALIEGAPPVYAYGDPSRFYLPGALPETRVPGGPPIASEAQRASKTFVAGRTGQGLQLNGSDSLRIPVGKLLSEARFENLDLNQGTIEFYFKPNWSGGGLLPNGTQRSLVYLQAGNDLAFAVNYYYAPGDWRLKLEAEVARAPTPADIHFDSGLLHPAVVERGKWIHFSFGWERHKPSKDPLHDFFPHTAFNWNMRLNEKNVWCPLQPWQTGRQFGNGAFRVRNEDLTELWIGSRPGEPRTLDGVIDDLRISVGFRYLGKSSVPDKVEMDKHTLLLFDFDGHTTGRAPDGRKVEAVFEDRPS